MGSEHDPESRDQGPAESEATEIIGPEQEQTFIEPPALGAAPVIPRATFGPPSSLSNAEAAGESGPEGGAMSGFGRFRDPQYLAEGGMGQILTAADPDIKRRVAIKILHPDVESQQEHLAKFRNEFELTGQLEHPNIVPVHETGRTDDGRIYFCMKLVKGKSLDELLKEQRKLAANSGRLFDPTPFLRHLLRVCDALSFAHSREIVHRDLKPANLMVGAFGEVLVMDWGLARKIRGQEEVPVEGSSGTLPHTPIDPLQTLEGTILGTPAYMAPEQAWGEMKEIDEQSDVYALGAILYEIVTGTPPRAKGSTGEILEQIRLGKLDRPRDRAPEANIPAELEAVVLKAMALEKRDRYPDARAFQADIQAYLDGRVLEAASYSPLQLLTKWVARNRKMCTGAAAVLLVSLTLFGVLRWQEWRDREEKFSAAWEEAARLLKGVGDITALRAERPAVDPKTGVERKDTPTERGDRKRAIEAHVAAAEALDRALQIRPGETKATRQRIQVGRAIGAMARQGRDYLLARQAFLQLQRHGVPRGEIAQSVKRVETAERSIRAHRKKRLAFILDDLARGLFRKGRPPEAPVLEDYYAEALGYRDLQTVEILGKDLAKLIEKAEEEGKAVNWSQPERDRAIFICRVLGRLGLAECVKPLGGWMGVVSDHDLLVEVGLALCNTRLLEAQPPLLKARYRLGGNSASWKQIRRFMNRIPEPESSKTPSTYDGFIRQGQLYEDKKEYDKAIASFSRAIEITQENPVAYNNRGVVLEANGEREAAIDDFSRAIELDPEHPSAYNNRGILRREKGDLQGAIEDYNRAIELDPEHPNAYINRGVVRQAQGDLESAIADYSKAIEHDPKGGTAYNHRGTAREDKGDLEGAIEDFSRAIEIDPKLASAYNNRGVVRGANGDLRGSIEDYTQAIEIDPLYAEAYANRGNARHASRDLQGAMEDYNKAIEIDPKLAKAYNNRGHVRQAGRDLQGAIEDYTRAIELDPKLVRTYVSRGNVRQAKGDLEGALEDYTRAIELDPRYPKPYNNRGNLWIDKGDLRRAIEDFNRAIELDPRYALAYVGRAEARQVRGDLRGAMEDYSKAVRLAPNLWQAWANLGFLLSKKGEYTQAIEALRKAHPLAPLQVKPQIARMIQQFEGMRQGK